MNQKSKAYEANKLCCQTISEVITAGYDGKHFDKTVVKPVVERFGFARTGTLLANMIMNALSIDPRYSADNRKWAEDWEYVIEDEQQCMEFLRQLEKHHPIIIDAFIAEFRKLADEYYHPIPDDSISAEDAYRYGYLSCNCIYPLRGEKAAELFEKDLPVLLLYGDDTEVYVSSKVQIEAHVKAGGICGIEKDVWLNDVLFYSMVNQSGTAGREVLLLYGANDRVGIYQLKNEKLHTFGFERMRNLTKKGLTVEKENYELVYDMEYPCYEEEPDTNILEQLYETFNIDRPLDYTGRSMSVSDVVVLHRNGQTKAYYVDSAGFVELPLFYEETEAFLVYFRNEEISLMEPFSNKEDALLYAENKHAEYIHYDVLYVSRRCNGKEEIIKTL